MAVAVGVVLAAGEGARFGGAKQLAPLDGRPLLAHAVEHARAARGVDRVVVVVGARAAEVAPVVEGAEVVVAGDWADGPPASLRAGLRAAGDADRVVVTLGDQPRVTAAVLEAALAAAGDGPLRTTYGGAPGHPVVLDRATAARVLAGEHPRAVLADVPTFEAGALCDPTDIDTHADLEALRT